MSVYLAHTARENQRVPEALRKKGLNYLRTAPTQFRISMYPSIRHHYYDIFKSQLYLVASAIWERRPIKSGAPHYYIGRAPTGFDYLPFEFPPVAISFRELGPNTRQWLIDHEFQQEMINEVNLWTKFQGLTIEEVQFLASTPTASLTTRTPYMYANLSAILGMMQIIKYLSILTIALHYPAIDTDEHFAAYNQNGKRPATEDAEGSQATSSTATARETMSTYDGAGYLSGVSVWLGSNADTPNSHLWKVKDSHLARPALTNTPADLSATAAVNGLSSGFAFPFESDVCRCDDDGPVPLIVSLFKPNFGTNADEQVRMMNTLKAAWGILKRTFVGDELAHYGKVCELALEGQASIRPIFSGGHYEGATIMGYNLTAVVDGEIRPSVSSARLTMIMQEFTTHEVALQQIYAILNSGGDVAMEGRTLTLAGLTSMATVREWVLQKKSLSVTQINDIKRYAERLRFDTRRMQSNYSNICHAIDILTGALPLDGMWPIEPRTVAEPDLVTTVLSGFGRMVPSLLVPDGRTINFTGAMPIQKQRIIEGRGNKGARTVVQNDSELTIQARLVDLDTAVADWKVTIDRKIYRVAPLQTAYANNYKVYRGNDRAAIYTALQRLGNTEATATGTEDTSDGRGRTQPQMAAERSGGVHDF